MKIFRIKSNLILEFIHIMKLWKFESKLFQVNYIRN